VEKRLKINQKLRAKAVGVQDVEKCAFNLIKTWKKKSNEKIIHRMPV